MRWCHGCHPGCRALQLGVVRLGGKAGPIWQPWMVQCVAWQPEAVQILVHSLPPGNTRAELSSIKPRDTWLRVQEMKHMTGGLLFNVRNTRERSKPHPPDGRGIGRSRRPDTEQTCICGVGFRVARLGQISRTTRAAVWKSGPIWQNWLGYRQFPAQMGGKSGPICQHWLPATPGKSPVGQ